jgi:hypothetical protein
MNDKDSLTFLFVCDFGFKEAFDLGDKVFLCGGVRNGNLSSECSVLGKNEFMRCSFNLILQIKSRK